MLAAFKQWHYLSMYRTYQYVGSKSCVVAGKIPFGEYLLVLLLSRYTHLSLNSFCGTHFADVVLRLKGNCKTLKCPKDTAISEHMMCIGKLYI